jgi:hypothetical protein
MQTDKKEPGTTGPLPPPGDQNRHRLEQDADELVHETRDPAHFTGEEDVDELVHEQEIEQGIVLPGETDPDDIVHHTSEPDDDLEVGGEG